MAALPIIAAIATIASAAMSAVSSMQQAKALNRQADAQQQAANTATQIAEYNATLAEREAQQAKEQAAYEADRSRERYEKLRGAQTAAAAHSGLQMTGSPLLLYDETAENSALDEMSIRYSGDIAAVNANAKAAQARFEGQVARNDAINRSLSLSSQAQGARMSAATTFIGGAASAAGGYYKATQPPASYGAGGTQKPSGVGAG